MEMMLRELFIDRLLKMGFELVVIGSHGYRGYAHNRFDGTATRVDVAGVSGAPDNRFFNVWLGAVAIEDMCDEHALGNGYIHDSVRNLADAGKLLDIAHMSLF